jgi:hypothetical protein
MRAGLGQRFSAGSFPFGLGGKTSFRPAGKSVGLEKADVKNGLIEGDRAKALQGEMPPLAIA